jgi:hypothetical protein
MLFSLVKGGNGVTHPAQQLLDFMLSLCWNLLPKLGESKVMALAILEKLGYVKPGVPRASVFPVILQRFLKYFGDQTADGDHQIVVLSLTKTTKRPDRQLAPQVRTCQ